MLARRDPQGKQGTAGAAHLGQELVIAQAIAELREDDCIAIGVPAGRVLEDLRNGQAVNPGNAVCAHAGPPLRADADSCMR